MGDDRDRPGVRLMAYSDADRALTIELEGDPAVKAQLGGPIGAVEAERIHLHRLERLLHGDLFFTVMVDGQPGSVGIAALFETAWGDSVIYEAGIMLLPTGQRAGLGLTVLRMIVECARPIESIDEVHGFTAVSNEGGNTICIRAGFRLLGECDLDYEGRPVRCNHWVFDLGG